VRTTLDIDDDVLLAAKDMAKAAGKTAGQMISDLARQTLLAPASAGADDDEFCGFRPLPRRGRKPVTNADVNRIRDELGI
jgi:hypothetical protein